MAIENWGVRQPVTIVAHSMGSLVSRYYVKRLGGHKSTERLVLLGGPHLGAPKAIINLGNPQAVLGFGMLGERVREVLMTFPSTYQMVPEYPCGVDQHGKPVAWLTDHSWLPEACSPMLKNAVEFRDELRGPHGVPMVCIFGYGLKTIAGAITTRNASGSCGKVEPVFDTVGDGTVPEASAVLDEAEIHPIRQYHGTLHVDNDVRKRLKVELAK
jgi:pimeloyl-ACP methyl ester carboxylesterase